MQRGNKRNRWLDTWIGTPALNLAASVHRRHRWPGGLPRRLAVMCSPALGDTLLFSGVLQDLREAMPNTEISHICMRQNLAAAEIIPGADFRLLIDLTRPVSSIRRLRAMRFDAFLDFTSWQRLTAFYTLLSGAGYTMGFATAGQRRSRGYDRTVVHREDRHETENFRAMLVGSEFPVAWPIAHWPSIQVATVSSLPFEDAEDLIVFHPWASGQRAYLREWPEARWIELAIELARQGTLFLVTGAASDQPRIEVLVLALRRAGVVAEPFVSPDGFRTLTQLLLRCRLVITVNTGVMHLAAIAGARTVAINGPNRNGRWGPLGPRALGVEAPGRDCGFLHLGFNFDGNPEDCMTRTSVAAVLAACRSLERTTGTPVMSAVSGRSLIEGIG